MSEVGRAYGVRSAALLWLLVGLWLFGLVLAPLAALVGRSLETVEPTSRAMIVEIGRLQDEIAGVRRDWERAADPELRADLDRRVRILTDRARHLENEASAPAVVWGIDTYARLAGPPLHGLLDGLGFALIVGLVTAILCYPVAHALAFTERPRRAALLVAAGLATYGLNEILRLHTFARILDPHAPLAQFLGAADGATGAGRLAVVLAMVHTAVPFMVLPIWAALADLDRRLIEAARDLGASPLRIHARIVLPHAARGIAIGAAATVALAAGSYSVPDVVTGGRGGDGLSLLLARSIAATPDGAVAAAGATVLLLACLVVIAVVIRLVGVRFTDLVRRGGRHA